MKITVISSKGRERSERGMFRSKFMPMRKCHFQLIISLNAFTSWWRQERVMCIKKKKYFHLECTNTHTIALRVIWNHAFSLFIAMCAWGCWLWRNGMSRKIKISITFKIFFFAYFFRSCNYKKNAKKKTLIDLSLFAFLLCKISILVFVISIWK